MKTHSPISRWGRLAALIIVLAVASGGAAVAKDGGGRGYLGVMLQDIGDGMAKALQLDEGTGVLVSEVVADGPADEAGLEDGDVILRFGDEEISGSRDLTRAVRRAEPGDKVELRIVRAGKERKLTVELGENEKEFRRFAWSRSDDGDAPQVKFFGDDGSHSIVIAPDGDDHVVWYDDDDDGEGTFHFETFDGESDRGYLGVRTVPLNEQLGEYFGVADGKGALVEEVLEDTPAAAAGLRAGDVILKLGDEDVEGPGDVHVMLFDHEAGEKIAITYVRKGDTRRTDVTLGELPDDFQGFRFGRFPEGFAREFHVAPPRPPRAPRALHKLLRSDDEAQIDEMRSELEKMRQELKDLKKDLDR